MNQRFIKDIWNSCIYKYLTQKDVKNLRLVCLWFHKYLLWKQYVPYPMRKYYEIICFGNLFLCLFSLMTK